MLRGYTILVHIKPILASYTCTSYSRHLSHVYCHFDTSSYDDQCIQYTVGRTQRASYERIRLTSGKTEWPALLVCCIACFVVMPCLMFTGVLPSCRSHSFACRLAAHRETWFMSLVKDTCRRRMLSTGMPFLEVQPGILECTFTSCGHIEGMLWMDGQCYRRKGGTSTVYSNKLSQPLSFCIVSFAELLKLCSLTQHAPATPSLKVLR